MAFTKKKNHQALAFIVLVASIFTVWHFATYNRERLSGVSFEEIPEDAVFIRHEEDEKIAEESGGVAMLHYATPEALASGGPIYGRLGHTIVSIEYEVPINSIPVRPIGDADQEGLSLIIDELMAKDNIVYDHMHIGIASSHTRDEDGGTNDDVHDDGHNHESTHSLQGGEEGVYLLHFMLIPHKTEVAYGLTCS